MSSVFGGQPLSVTLTLNRYGWSCPASHGGFQQTSAFNPPGYGGSTVRVACGDTTVESKILPLQVMDSESVSTSMYSMLKHITSPASMA